MDPNIPKLIEFIRTKFKTPEGFIPLHEPRFCGNEKRYTNECIDTTFVSSVGAFVTRFEQMIAEFTGSKHAIAAVNGTAALHISLLLCDVKSDDEVITQALTFIATANAISYTGATPIFLDVDCDTLGLSPSALKDFLSENAIMDKGFCINKTTGRRIRACVPMHTFGHPCKIDEIVSICEKYNIDVVEDAAESLGSYFKDQHTGTFGKFGTISFNGNKIITTGGGGMILTNDDELGKLAKHITTTAKVPHKWAFEHDMIGYNYRLTNLAASLGCAQMEELPGFLINKRKLAEEYSSLFSSLDVAFITEPENSRSNYWLNAIVLNNKEEQEYYLNVLFENKIMARPIWMLMNKLDMYKNCQCGNLKNSEWFADRIVNLPSSSIS